MGRLLPLQINGFSPFAFTNACINQQSTEHGEKGTPTGNWILAVKTPIGPKEYYTKYSDKFKVDSDTVRLNADIQCAFAT